jgi:hypothetical protein
MKKRIAKKVLRKSAYSNTYKNGLKFYLVKYRAATFARAHYLLWNLQQYQGNQFTPERVRNRWSPDFPFSIDEIPF